MVSADLPDPLEQLIVFGQRSDAKIRPVLLRVLVDMFVSKPNHGPAELQQFEEIMVHLLDDADDETRLAVAEQLSKHPLTPRALLDRFVAERSGIAAKVLAHAGLDPRTLSAAAVFGTALMAEAVARRPDIDAAVVRSLAERPEIEVLCALVENKAAPVDRPLLRYLARRAQSHPQLAARLLERGDTAETVSLFLVAGRAQRAELIAGARRQDLGSASRPAIFQSSPETLAAIRRAANVPGLDGLDVTLAGALQCTAEKVARLVDDAQGEPLALILAALGVPSEVAARIFILGDPTIGRSYSKVRRLVDIVATVPARAASKLVAAMIGRSTEEPRRSASLIEAVDVVRRGEAAQARRDTQGRKSQPLRANQAG